ncbi:MAG: pyridoxal phosphate-dependent aminotransferase [Myxococcota bacterium]
MTVDVVDAVEPASAGDEHFRSLSDLASAIEPSEILTIAYEVRERIRSGEDLLNLTVGDFSPKEFPIAAELNDALVSAVRAGETNYPPASGVLECRVAVQRMFERRLGLRYPVESVLILGGARPAIFGTYACLVNAGDRVVYGLPSWNNNYYTTLTGGHAVEIPTAPERHFFVSPENLEPHITSARLLCLNTPQNPTGTVMNQDDLETIARMVVKENRRRKHSGERALYLLFDQVYWPLTFADVTHRTPVSLVPEVAPYTIFVDGISKGYSATGLRVGWAVGPVNVIRKMTALLAHVGCWAPRPEQIATAKLLENDGAVDAYLESIRSGVFERLAKLNNAVQHYGGHGFDVDTIRPQGAIYLSIKLNLVGKRARNGKVLENDEDIRRHILSEAGIALVPFRCFGLHEDTRWFRASVGVASLDDCASVRDRLGHALKALS